MMEDDVFRRVVEVISLTFNPAAAVGIMPSTTSADVPGWDSLSHTMLIMNIEDAFGVELPVDEIADLADVGALVALVRRTL